MAEWAVRLLGRGTDGPPYGPAGGPVCGPIVVPVTFVHATSRLVQRGRANGAVCRHHEVQWQPKKLLY